MRKAILVLFIADLFITAFAHYAYTSFADKVKEPVLFAPGIISTADDEFGSSFTPDGKTCYFSIKSPSTIASNVYVICVSHFKDGRWTEPEVAPFSGHYKDFNPCVSPDGLKLFFISNRPVN